MKIVAWTIAPIGKFAETLEIWGGLNRAHSGDTPLLDPLFLAPLIQEFADDRDVVATYREAGQVRAIAVLRRVNFFAWQTLQPANAPIGLWNGDPALDLERVLGELAARLSASCAMLGVTQQDPASLPRPSRSRRLSTFDYIRTARIEFPPSFETYWQSRSKNFRQNVTRQRNRIKREQIEARLECLTDPADMARAVADYARLETAGWKAEEGTAVRLEDPQGRFYVKMLTAFAERGESFVYRYRFADRVVASDLCILRDGTLYILKTAYDEAQQGLSPAHLMRVDAFAQAIDAGRLRKVEFYGPVKEWHTRFTDDIRTMYHANFYRLPVLKRLHEARRARREKPAPDAAPGDAAAATGDA